MISQIIELIAAQLLYRNPQNPRQQQEICGV